MSYNPKQPEKKAFPKLEMPDDIEPLYTNMVRISHSPAEIILDFAQLLPGQPRLKVSSRMVMSPMAAKLFHRALGENLSRFESVYGEIAIPRNNSLASDLFRSVQPPDSSSPAPESPTGPTPEPPSES
jgi:hypothetical protein